jgi:anti-sigma-K factor RskA
MPTPDEPDMAAAELALGLLEGEERAQAMRRVLADPAFAREVARWHDRLAALFAWWPEVAPPPALEARVMAAVEHGGARAPTSLAWRVVAIGMSIAAAGLLAVLALRPAMDERPAAAPTIAAAPAPAAVPVLAAAIAPGGDTPSVPAFYDPATGALRLAVAELAPARRSPQLWVLDKAGTPHSLAVLSNGQSVTVTVPVTLRATIAQGAVLAISIEPAGGTRSAAPTGPVVATGALTGI